MIRRLVLFTLLMIGLAGGQVLGPRKQVSSFAPQTTLTGTLAKSGNQELQLRTANGVIPMQLGAMQRDRRTMRAIDSGTDVQVTGRLVQHRGKTLFVADEVNLGGQIIKVRAKSGIALRAPEVQR